MAYAERIEQALEQAAERVRGARSLMIGAGAGMGVDSGLPDFRGPQGFWNAYPPYQHLGLDFYDLANPRWFLRDPSLAWGFYGHRLGLYRETRPHAGFDVLRRWSEERASFVFTTNVDGAFQKAGWSEEEVYEPHGSIHWLQCALGCHEGLWSAEGETVEVDPETFRAEGEHPRCIACGEVARPNILMFGDYGYLGDRAYTQQVRYLAWLEAAEGPVVVIETGGGTALPTVRYHSEELLDEGHAVIRINPREAQGPEGVISIPLGAREALEAIDARIQGAAPQ